MRAQLAITLLLSILASGCVSGSNLAQGTQADSNTLTTKHLHLECPIQLSGADGIHAILKKCSGALQTGARKDTSIDCTGLTGNLNHNAFSTSHTSSLILYTYTAGHALKSYPHDYDIEGGNEATATCKVDEQLDTYGHYVIQLDATCYRDGKPWYGGYQSVPDGCDIQQDDYNLSNGGL